MVNLIKVMLTNLFCFWAVLSWFNATGESSGFEKFVSLTDLKNPAKGFIVNDSLSVQIQFEAVSSTNYYSSNAAQVSSF